MMRTVFFVAPLLVLLACTGKDADSVQGSGGHIEIGGTGPAGGASAAGETSASGGKPASAGPGGTTSGGASNGGTSTSAGASTSGGKGGQGMGGQELVACDLRKVTCRVAQPSCPENQVPTLVDNCFGPCAAIESCACSAAEECPFTDRYTCWQRTHCGPYVR
ncbi:MAG TPA: hypothetical protein VFK05_24365 [Polyangiaceae bacterium]|nr:hypothetical protein [Polyangiaceae bacterium]